jgi:hypothetical protein
MFSPYSFIFSLKYACFFFSIILKVADRPITQQGLTGLRTAAGTSSVGQRHVQDKSYFVGILRAKMSELSTEIKHIQVYFIVTYSIFLPSDYRNGSVNYLHPLTGKSFSSLLYGSIVS